MDRHVVWLDPSQGTSNQGDRVIADAVSDVLAELGITPVLRLSTHDRMPWGQIDTISDPLFIVGGTNLLNSDHPLRRWWRIGPRDATSLRNRVLLCGVGWWQYQRDPNLYARWLYKTALAKSTSHSVRDSYTLDKLSRLGIPAVNTGCPTTWALSPTPERRDTRGARVVVALTDYAQDQDADRALLEFLNSIYDEVVVWPQGTGDREYVSRLGERHGFLEGDLDAFNRAMRDSDTDYVGTRLHAGIRALQLGARSTIVEVDNRAREMGSDIGLPVVSRGLGLDARAFIAEPREVSLRVPHGEIRRWMDSTRQWLASAN